MLLANLHNTWYQICIAGKLGGVVILCELCWLGNTYSNIVSQRALLQRMKIVFENLSDMAVASVVYSPI